MLRIGDSELAQRPVYPPSEETIDTGLMALGMVAAYHGLTADLGQIRHEFRDDGGKIGVIGIVRAARKLDLRARHVRSSLRKLAKMPLPAIAKLSDGNFLVLAKVSNDRVLIQRPGEPPADLSYAEIGAVWSGELILVTRRARGIIGETAFGIGWFLPVLAKYKTLFSEVLLASFFLQLFGLATPLFFQVIVDKVLVHRGLTTLDVLIIGLVGITVFDSLLGFLRTYLFSHTTSRVDVQLGSQLFRHLMGLPIAYFESRQAGQTVARVRELENVRDFLTSSALTVVIDLGFTVIFFAVMWLFSPTLTLIVLATMPAYALLSLTITPALRARVEERFQRGAASQSFLVESVTGIHTLKSMAVEPQMQRRWDETLAAYVSSSFRAVTLGTFGSQAVTLINKIMVAAVLWFGARQVMSGELTVGQLVAFNMLAGQVSQPIIRLAQLWQDFQQFRISIDRLGDVLNTKTEVAARIMPANLPPLKGRVEFQNVTFRYRPGETEVLRNASFVIEPGSHTAFVGPSGSGKSTITKLIQKLYTPESGRILIDGIDISMLDPSWLRRQIGVVLQDNVLFNRTLRENIALSDPAMPMQRVIEAAKIAAANDFILKLPQGYETPIEERGLNLSGGQKQRIAIARALATLPRILILDEATSGLDDESEAAVMQGLARLKSRVTMVSVTHRASARQGCTALFECRQGEVCKL